MANRLVSNVYIIDSHQVAQPLYYGNSGSTSSGLQQGKMKVTAVIFMGLDTSAACSIAVGNTANVILNYGFMVAGTGATQLFQQKTEVYRLGYGVPLSSVYIPTITATTACLILE